MLDSLSGVLKPTTSNPVFLRAEGPATKEGKLENIEAECWYNKEDKNEGIKCKSKKNTGTTTSVEEVVAHTGLRPELGTYDRLTPQSNTELQRCKE